MTSLRVAVLCDIHQAREMAESLTEPPDEGAMLDAFTRISF